MAIRAPPLSTTAPHNNPLSPTRQSNPPHEGPGPGGPGGPATAGPTIRDVANPLLHDLEDAGLLVSRERVESGRVLRYYTATEQGRRTLANARTALVELARELLPGGALLGAVVAVTVLLVVVVVAFAFSMGAHYTGACMGMPRALGAVTTRGGLLIMAPLTLVGATFASHRVEHTVGHDLLTGAGLSVTGLVIVVGIAFALTSAFNVLRIPTSTIQILVFSVVGAGLAAGVGVHWSTIATLAAIWVAAPPVAAAAGYALTHILDRIPAVRVEARAVGATLAARGEGPAEPAEAEPSPATSGTGWIAGALIAVGALASFTMGSNDVANATGSLVGTHTLSPLLAGLVGGAGLAAGVLTWGRPLLRRVAFEIVTVDRPMATAAQLVQAGVVLAAVGFGFFTSMNQALVGAMAGTAAARGRQTVHTSTLIGILRGWVVGPGAGIALAYVVTRIVSAATGLHTVIPGP